MLSRWWPDGILEDNAPAHHIGEPRNAVSKAFRLCELSGRVGGLARVCGFRRGAPVEPDHLCRACALRWGPPRRARAERAVGVAQAMGDRARLARRQRSSEGPRQRGQGGLPVHALAPAVAELLRQRTPAQFEPGAIAERLRASVANSNAGACCMAYATDDRERASHLPRSHRCARLSARASASCRADRMAAMPSNTEDEDADDQEAAGIEPASGRTVARPAIAADSSVMSAAGPNPQAIPPPPPRIEGDEGHFGRKVRLASRPQSPGAQDREDRDAVPPDGVSAEARDGRRSPAPMLQSSRFACSSMRSIQKAIAKAAAPGRRTQTQPTVAAVTGASMEVVSAVPTTTSAAAPTSSASPIQLRPADALGRPRHARDDAASVRGIQRLWTRRVASEERP